VADIHIADFHKDVAKVFCQLYAGFPRKLTLFVEDISGSDTPDEFGLHSTRHQACFATFLWLAEEGYIRYDSTIRQEAIDQTTLTHRGFTLLSTQLHCQSLVASGTTHTANQLTDQPPSAQIRGDFAPAIDLIRSAVRGGSSSAIEHIVQIILHQPR